MRLQEGMFALAPYVMDYGAPVGYRLALKHPERVTAIVDFAATRPFRTATPTKKA